MSDVPNGEVSVHEVGMHPMHSHMHVIHAMCA